MEVENAPLFVDDVWKQKIVDLFNEDQRYYHNYFHIKRLLAEYSTYQPIADPVIEQAIWFHDIIYQPQSKKGDNETQSNELYIEWHNSTSNDDKEQQEVSQIILATIDHKPVADCPKCELFLDLDLSVLGWNP